MAVTTVKGFQSVAAGQFLDVLPASQEWIIHNYRYEGPIELHITTNGTDNFKFDADTAAGGGAILGRMDHLTPNYYIRIKNTDSVTRKIAYDGIVSS